MLRLGVHTSIHGGIELSLIRANQLDCNTAQIFSHNPRGWKVRRIPENNIKIFKELRNDFDINPIFIHTSYLINLATQDTNLLNLSEQLLKYELTTADELDIEFVVLHTGSASKDNGKVARKRAIASLNRVLSSGKWKAGFLLENTAGEKGDISSKIEEIAEIADGVKEKGISGICFDTCHAFSAGYNIGLTEAIQSLIDKIIKYIGIEKVKLIHLNDSKRDLGACVDRHEHIGMGKIGKEGFKNILTRKEFRNIPLILETPKKSNDDDDIKNLKTVRHLLRF